MPLPIAADVSRLRGEPSALFAISCYFLLLPVASGCDLLPLAAPCNGIPHYFVPTASCVTIPHVTAP